jgi:hypothetical protein
MEGQQGSNPVTSQSEGVQGELNLVRRVTAEDYLSELSGREDEVRRLAQNRPPPADARVDEADLGKTANTPITSLQQLATKPSGAWFVNLQFIGQAQLVFDISPSRPGQIWLRLNHKLGQSFNGTTGLRWTVDSIRSLIPHIKSFGVSDNMNTIFTEYSWYLEDVTMHAARTTGYLKWASDVSLEQYLMNIFNGLTPTGTGWSIGYTAAYVTFCGLFKTFGTWTSMYVGCNWTSHVSVDTKTSFRCGGHPRHTGEFIHTSCNGYQAINHSITSRVDWGDNRVFWVRVE